MKYTSFVMAACLLWLTGCSSLPTASRGAVYADRAEQPLLPTAPSTTESQATAVYPAGAMSPILQGHATASSVAALAPPADLWERIRRGYAMPDLKNELVHDREQWYTTRPEYIYRMTERSRKYLFHIVEELERRNMPTELALLPFVESAFNPQAVSSAKAAGMWQFMPATGRTFELKQSVFRDDRRDVLASTRAALDYLQKLYGMFGDWHLALAAYNWGEGSVGRAITKNQKAGLGTSYLDLSMPMETRFYVPKLQAVKNIVANPAAFQSRLPLIENHPYFQTVDLQHDIDVAIAARLAEVSVEDFRALNPSARKPVLLAAGTPQILLPWDNAKLFQSNLEAYTGGRIANWTAWIAPATLKVADAAKRVGMSESELRAVNDIPPRMQIKAGSTLVVRRSGGIEADVSDHIADNGQLSLTPDTVLRKTSVRVGKQDSMASLTKRYKVSAASISEWNQLGSTARLRAGQTVVLYLPVQARHSGAANSRQAHSQGASGKAPARGKKSTRLARK